VPLDWPSAPLRRVARGADEYVEYDVDGDGQPEYVQRLRGGFKDQLYFLESGRKTALRCISRPAADPRSPPFLLLLLDGVAYERIAGLYAAGHFRLFRRPARLISVFPTLTDPAYDVLFETGPTPGYEAGGFDRARNRVTPSLRSYLRGANEAWVRYCDYRLSFLLDALMYLAPRQIFRYELSRVRRVFDARRAAGARQVVLYILSTDGIGHMLTPEQIDHELVRLDGWLERIVYDQRGDLEIALLADHGLSALPPEETGVERFDLAGVLKKAGLHVRKSLRATGDVVLPTFGLLDVARLYAFDAATRACAVAALRDRDEIEILAERDGDAVRVYCGPASAVVRRRGDEFAYECVTGDPLELNAVMHGHLGGAGYAGRAEWLAGSAEAAFPAGPPRLWDGLFGLTREQPDIVVSLKGRACVGSGLLSRFVRLRGTHGGLHRRVSETFAMTTAVEVPSPCDLGQVRELLQRVFGWDPRGGQRK
jgi:hypothetical protein